MAYVTNSYADTVSVLDLATSQVVDTIHMDHGRVHSVQRWPAGDELQLANTPMNPTFSIAGDELYVPNPEGYNVAVVDVGSNSIVRIIELAMKPNDIAFVPGGDRAVITLLGHATGRQGAMTVLDVATGEYTDPVMVGTQPEELVLTPDGRRAYVVSKSLWVIDVEANEVEAEVHLPYWCYDAVLAPDGATLYLTATFGHDKIVKIDTASNAVAGTIDVPMPACMAFTHSEHYMLVSNVYNNSVQRVDVRTGVASDPAPVPELPSYLALTGDGRRAVLCHPAGDSVTILDTETLGVVAIVETGLGPCAVAIGTLP